MGYELNNLMKMYGVGTPSRAAYTGVAAPGAPPADTASAEDKAKFDESVRKYQLDQKAYEQYKNEYGNRIASANIYDQPQFRTSPPPKSGEVAAPARDVLRAPSYGAISQFANLTPQQQGEMYKQQRDIGYTDADIRKATAAQIGTPNEATWSDYMKTAYPEYAKTVERQYGSLFNRTGFGTGAGQIDNPGYNYWINQLSSGAATPENLAAMMQAGAPSTNPVTTTPTTTPVTTTPTTIPTTTPSDDINALYQRYFNRQADPTGLQYWQQSGLTGDALKNAIIGGAQGNDLYYYNTNIAGIPMNNPNVDHSGATPSMNAARGGYINGYAHGGHVRTHYQTGGRSEAGDNLAGLEEAYFGETPMQQQWRGAYPMPVNANEPAATPTTPPPPAETAGAPAAAEPSSAAGLEALISRYMAPSNQYSRDLSEARQRSQTETEAFSNLIKQVSERGESPASRSEMYFRLAAAFGSPTRTGSMGETLSKVGEQMGEYSKGRRAEEAERRGLALKSQEIRMAGAREDLATTKALAAQEASDRRAIAKEMIKEYIASGKAASDEGKRARDAGYKEGTPEYNNFVRRQIESKIESGDLYRQAMLTIQEGNLELRRAAEARRAEAEKQLSPTELKMKQDSENALSASKSALRDITEALRLNDNSFGMSGTDWAQYQALSRAGSNAPRVQNTRIIENLLSRSAIDSLKEKFGAGITNEERRALVELEGALAKTPQERKIILDRSVRELQRSIEREERRLRDISSGIYRRQTEGRGSGEGESQ